MNLTILQIQNLKQDPWRVFTGDQKTIRAIIEKQKELEEAVGVTEKIHYSTKPYLTFIVTFEVAKFLAENRNKFEYDFIAFHKKKSYKPWVIWKEGNTMSEDLGRNLNKLFGNYGVAK